MTDRNRTTYAIRYVDNTTDTPTYRRWVCVATSKAEARHKFTEQFPGPSWDRIVRSVDNVQVSV